MKVWENSKKLWKRSPLVSRSSKLSLVFLKLDRNTVHVFYFLNRYAARQCTAPRVFKLMQMLFCTRYNLEFYVIRSQIFPTRFLRCSSEVTVKVLKKFLIMKFAIPETHNVSIFSNCFNLVKRLLICHATLCIRRNIA